LSPGGRLTLEYDRLSTLGDVEFIWETSSDFRAWNAASTDVPSVTPLADQLRETVSAVVATDSTALKFYRLRVQLRPSEFAP
jgi:hypothetical protein